MEDIQEALKAAHLACRHNGTRPLRHTIEIVAEFFKALHSGVTVELVPGKPLKLPKEITKSLYERIKLNNEHIFVDDGEGNWAEREKTVVEKLQNADYSTIKLWPGQRWIPQSVRYAIKPRTVVWCNRRSPINPDIQYMTVGYLHGAPEDARYEHEEFPCDGECSVMRFAHWVKRHNAVHRGMLEE